MRRNVRAGLAHIRVGGQNWTAKDPWNVTSSEELAGEGGEIVSPD